MSYILEALRKADAERERRAVPDLRAQPLPGGPADDEAAPVPALPWRYAGLGLVLAMMAGGAWWWLSGDEVPAAGVTPGVPPSASSAPPAAAAMAGPPSAPAPSPTSTPSQAPAAAAVAAAAAAATSKPPPAVPRPRPRPEPAAKAPPKALPKAAPAPAPAAAPPPPERVPPLAELAVDLRQQVPPLAIGGSVYSPQASARMVVVNGQVFQEGSQLAPELKLEQIRPKSAVFSIRGQRFEVPL
jgi:general secretion pathway protein B